MNIGNQLCANLKARGHKGRLWPPPKGAEGVQANDRRSGSARREKPESGHGLNVASRIIELLTAARKNVPSATHYGRPHQ
jgi:hypothetical protein